MSIQAITYVIDHSPSRGLCRLVLISIANHANRHGASCYPSVEMIADEAGVGRATAWRCIEKLEADGEVLIQRGRGRGHRSEYVLVMGRDREACAVLFNDPEATVEGEEPRRRGRPPKVPQRNNSGEEKVSERNKKVPPRMELLDGFDDCDKSSIKVPQRNSKSSIPSRAPASDYLTVKEPSERTVIISEDATFLFRSFCEITNAELSEMPDATVRTQGTILDGLLADYGRADIEGCMRWLQTWRTVPWTMTTVRKEIAEWIAKGRPASGKTEPKPPPMQAPRPSSGVVSRADGSAQRRLIGRG